MFVLTAACRNEGRVSTPATGAPHFEKGLKESVSSSTCKVSHVPLLEVLGRYSLRDLLRVSKFERDFDRELFFLSKNCPIGCNQGKIHMCTCSQFLSCVWAQTRKMMPSEGGAQDAKVTLRTRTRKSRIRYTGSIFTCSQEYMHLVLARTKSFSCV